MSKRELIFIFPLLQPSFEAQGISSSVFTQAVLPRGFHRKNAVSSRCWILLSVASSYVHEYAMLCPRWRTCWSQLMISLDTLYTPIKSALCLLSVMIFQSVVVSWWCRWVSSTTWCTRCGRRGSSWSTRTDSISSTHSSPTVTGTRHAAASDDIIIRPAPARWSLRRTPTTKTMSCHSTVLQMTANGFLHSHFVHSNSQI